MWKAMSIASLIVMAAACGVPRTGPQPAAGHYKLYEAAASVGGEVAVSVVDSESHRADRTLPFGTPNRDWTHLYTVKGVELRDVDPQTGSTLHVLGLARAFQLPPASVDGLPGGLSADGSHLALESWDRVSDTPTATHLLVVDTSYATRPVAIDLDGWFEFDTISNDGQRVYLVQYLTPGRYRVRLYDVLNRRLDPTVITDKTDPKDSMTGIRLSGVASPDGQFLYSIYVRQNDGAFIHALPLDGTPVAFCIDLPSPGYASSADAMGWALAMSPSGRTLYAVNAALGIVSQVDVGTGTIPTLSRTVRLDTATSAASLVPDVEAKELGGNSAAVSSDGRILIAAGASGVVWIDTSSLRERAASLSDWRIVGLAASPDGKLAYAVSDGGMIAELSFASRRTEATFDPGALGYPITMMRVAAA